MLLECAHQRPDDPLPRVLNAKLHLQHLRRPHEVGPQPLARSALRSPLPTPPTPSLHQIYPTQARKYADEAVALCTDDTDSRLASQCLLVQGVACAFQARADAGISAITSLESRRALQEVALEALVRLDSRAFLSQTCKIQTPQA